MSEISETEIKSMTKEQNYIRGYKDGKSDVLDKIRAEIGKSKTEHEMQLAERDIKGRLLVSHIYCDIVSIIDKYKAESEDKE